MTPFLRGLRAAGCWLVLPSLLIAATVRPYQHQPTERVTDPLVRLILREMDLSLQSAVGVVNTAIPVLGGGSFADNAFSVYNAGDPSKQLVFAVSGVGSGNTRTLTVPNASGTLPLLGYSQIWGGANYFKDDRFWVQDDADTSKRVQLQVSSVTTGTTRTLTVPNSSGTLTLNDFAQTFSADKTFTGNVTWDGSAATGTLSFLSKDAVGAWGIAGGSNTGPQWFDVSSSKTMYFNTGGASLTGNVDMIFPVAGGTLLTNTGSAAMTNKSINSGSVSLTNQGADITTTNITITPSSAAVYKVEVVLMCTTSDVTAGTLNVTIGWTDNVGATSRNVSADPGATGFPLTLAATGRTSGEVTLRRASGNITYAVVVTGIYGAAKYALYIRALGMGT